MRKIGSGLLAGALLTMACAAPAADLESLAKSAAASAPDNIQPFTEQELIDHVRAGNFDKYADSICPAGYETYIPKAKLTNAQREGCQKRLKAFSESLFGACHFMQLHNQGGNLLGFVLKYASIPNEDTARRQDQLKIINGYLENFRQAHPSTNCTPAHYETLKNLANKVLEAATLVTDEVKQRAADQKTAELNKRAEAEAKQKASASCKENSTYKVYEVGTAILGLQAENTQFRAAIDREKAAGKVSGNVNQGNLNHLGQRIVINDDRINRFFARYRELGGRAAKADAIQPMANPCQ